MSRGVSATYFSAKFLTIYRKSNMSKDTKKAKGGLGTVSAANVPVAPVIRIWNERFIVGTLNLVAGEPGAGKSNLAAEIAGGLSRKGLIGIVSNAEDDAGSVTIPRLLAADAILERIHVIPLDDTPLFPDELEGLEHVIRTAGIHYVILDPISAHFNPERLIYNRPFLRRLASIARATNCMILGVHHTTKSGLVAGPNSGLLGSCRAVYIYGFDANDEDRRALHCHKINGVEAPPTMVIEHETVEVLDKEGNPVEAGRLRVVGQSNNRASRKRPRRNAERDAACAKWLTEFLAACEDCEATSNSIKQACREEGYSQETLRRAKVSLEIEHLRKGWGGDGAWYWRLPEDHPARQSQGDPEAVGE